MSVSPGQFSKKFKDELCLEVISTSQAIKTVATESGAVAETLRSWLRKCRIEHASGAETGPLILDERARRRELERRNRELKAEVAFLKKWRHTSRRSYGSGEV